MLDKSEFTLNTTERRLLYGIYEVLQEIKALLPVPATAEQTAGDGLDSLRRNDLMSMVKKLPEKPDGWSKLSNAELIQLLRGEDK